MTIGELIEKLKECNEFATVLIEDKHRWWKCEVDVIIDNIDTITLL